MPVDPESLYRRFAPMVLRRCRRLLSDEEQAVEAMQDTFVELIRKQELLTEDAPSSLLYTMATNICLNRLRARRRHPVDHNEELLLSIAGTDDPAERAGSLQLIDRIFADEKEQTRTIAVLHYVDGFTLEETAAAVGMSVSGIRKRLRKLRERGLVIRDA